MTKTTTTTVTEKFNKDGKLTEKVTETRIEEDDNIYNPAVPCYPYNPAVPYNLFGTPSPNKVTPIITCSSDEVKV